MKKNLPDVEAGVNRLEPPLATPARRSTSTPLSVFTHLDENLNRRWITELRRVLKPRGMAFITINGDQHAEHELPAESLARYRAGEFVTTYDEVQASNLCAAYSDAEWATRELPDEFERARAPQPRPRDDGRSGRLPGGQVLAARVRAASRSSPP